MINIIVLYSATFVAILSTGISFLRNYRKFDSRERSVYIYLLISFVLWIAANAVSDIIKVEAIALFGAQVALVFAIHMATAIYLVATVFPLQVFESGKEAFGKRNTAWVVYASIFVTLILLIFQKTTYNVAFFEVVKDGPASFVPGGLYLFAFAYAFLILSMGFVHWMRRIETFTLVQKEQIKLLSVSLILVLISLIIGFAVLPLVNLTKYTPLVFLSVTLFSFQLQQNILSRNVAINFAKTAKQVTLYLIFAVLILAMFWLVTLTANAGGDFLSLFLIVAIAFVAVHNSFESANKKFLGNETEASVMKFIETSTTVYNVEEVLDLLQEALDQIVPNGKTVIELIGGKHSQFTFRIMSYWKLTGRASMLSPESIIARILRLEKTAPKSRRIVPLKQILVDMTTKNVSLVIPLNKKVSLQGLMVIKGGNLVLDTQVLNALSLLSHNASVAISRATLYQETQDFAESLQGKVKERTREINRARLMLERKNEELGDAYKELQSLDKAKSDFISMASHQLRTPISIARGYLSMVLEGDFGSASPEQELLLKKIMGSIKQLNNIVEDILNASRIEQGRLVMNFEEGDVIEMIKNVTKELEQKAANKKLKLKVVPDCKSYIEFYDKNKMFEVVFNLVDNAINYTQQGSVTVTTESSKSKIVIEVTDSGIGIPKDQQDKIFQRFSRAPNAMKIRPDGSGIGLFIAKTIVDAHGGKIWFKSEENKGTTFYIEIPNIKRVNKSPEEILSDQQKSDAIVDANEVK